MLEICFNDSVKGALKMAQRCTNSHSIGGGVGVITSSNKSKLLSFIEKRKALRQFKRERMELTNQAVSLGGNSKDVLGISFHLSEGDIVAPIELEQCPRKDFILSSMIYNRCDDLGDLKKSALEFWQNTMNDLERLKQGADKVRIWVDNTPEAACGLLFVADILVNTDTVIHIVPLPKKHQRDDNCYVEYGGWGDVHPELFGTFLDREKILTKEEVLELSSEWKRLQKENAPLRAVEDDKVISVDESYYDNLIRKEFPKESCTIAGLIGNSISKQKILTGDVFIAKRIKFFIQNGELEIITSSEKGFYRNIIKVVK